MIDLMRRRLCGAGILLLATAFVLLGNATAFAEIATVTIDNFTFKPAMLTLKRGSTVTFVNHDDIPHSIVDSGGKFRSKVLDTNESFNITLDADGNVTYFCGLHPHMTGRIVVTP
jgi:plastocyanin